MDIVEGLFFALFWASATIATKFAVRSVDPFLLTCIRFLVVAAILLLYNYGIRKKHSRLPTRHEWGTLLILGTLNILVYMSGFLIAIKTVSAGLISLVMAANPLILIILSGIFLHKRPTPYQWTGIIISFAGLVLAAIPNLAHNHATLTGLVALIIANISISAGSVYYSRSKPVLPKMLVNTWQITIGGLLFLPVIWFNKANNFIHPGLNFFLSFAWLVVPVSIVAYALWLHLLHKDPVKASGWLFLTPALGYLMAVIILHEPVTLYGVMGAVLVITGLMYSRRKYTTAAVGSSAK